jgi:hypothetical protein
MPRCPFFDFSQQFTLRFKGREYVAPMLYVVEIRRDREHLAQVMSAIREWLDAQRVEPDAFRCDQDEETILCRLEFKLEREARACAEAFQGQVSSTGGQSPG